MWPNSQETAVLVKFTEKTLKKNPNTHNFYSTNNN